MCVIAFVCDVLQSHVAVEERSRSPFVRDLTLALCSAAIGGQFCIEIVNSGWAFWR